jgi:hypothetical protein
VPQLFIVETFSAGKSPIKLVDIALVLNGGIEQWYNIHIRSLKGRLTFLMSAEMLQLPLLLPP